MAPRRGVADTLLHPRARLIVLVAATAVFAGVAIALGLPSQPDLPKGLERIIIVPDVPDLRTDARYDVTVSWVILGGDRPGGSLIWDTAWVLDSGERNDSGESIYVAVWDEETAGFLDECAREPDGPGRVTAVDVLPAKHFAALNALDLAEQGFEVREDYYRYFRLDDRDPASGGAASLCHAPPERSITRDDIELHIRAPELTIVTDDSGDARDGDRGAEDEDSASKGEPRVRSAIIVPALETGWTADDVRAFSGERQDRQEGTSWSGVRRDPEFSSVPDGYAVFETGPIIYEASSVNEARRTERNLFWSGLLVGVAASTLLMLFEAIPWRGRGAEASGISAGRGA